MLKHSFIKNDYFVCLFGALGAYNLIGWIFFTQKYPNDFYLYGTINYKSILIQLISDKCDELADVKVQTF